MIRTLRSNPGPYVGKVAWSNYFSKCITDVNFEDSDNWTFKFCNRKGKVALMSSTYKAQSNVKEFKWEQV